MTRQACALVGALLSFFLVGCGGGSANGSPGGGSGTPQNIPALTSIAPSSTTAGASSVSLVLFGSNFANNATVQWNGNMLSSSWVSSTQITATVPASDVASVGNARVTVTNPDSGGGTSAAQTFTIAAAPVATTWVRSVPGVATPQNIAWDAAHGELYVSVASTDPAIPNTVVPINPLTAVAGTPVPAGNNPDLLAISSDSSYLWVGLDGDNGVQRFLLPGLTKDISFTLPLDSYGNPQRPVDLQAARTNPHTVALVAENINLETGQGVYIYDDATRRQNFVPSSLFPGGALIDWIQWSANDSVIYGSQSITIDAGGVATLDVNSSGVSLASYNGGQIGPPYSTQFDTNNGLLYSLGGAFNPINGALIGSFTFPLGEATCTVDGLLGRYYCVVAYSTDGTDVTLFELWVFDLNSYSLINRIYFGATAAQQPSSVSGSLRRLVRWGNAGLALVTNTQQYYGNGGVFLIDGAAVNPNAPADVASGATPGSYAWMASLTPQATLAGSGDVTVTIRGNNFTPASTACRQCNYLQFQFLPTSYVNPQQLNVTIPASLLSSPGQLPISIFDDASYLFSSDSLTFSVTPPATAGATMQVNQIGLAGLAMAWDPASALIYVGTSELDGAYPNSIVAIDGNTGSIVKTQTVSSDPDLLSVSANSQYLYTAYAGSTTMSQFQLPSLGSPLMTWVLNDPGSSAVYWAADIEAAPENPHTTAVALLNLESDPDVTGGVAVYDDNVERSDFIEGWGPSTNVFDTIAWGASDQTLSATASSGYNGGALSVFQVIPSGAVPLATGTAAFNVGELHSDFGTGLIYSDDGKVADPTTQAVVGSYNASGLAAPDSSLNRVFILGQTSAQANTNNFTIDSFDEKAYTPISSMTLGNLLGTPVQLIRWGNSGLAVLTMNQDNGSQGMLYLVQDATFVSNAQTVASRLSKPQELVQRRWKRVSKTDIVKMVQARRAVNLP